MIRTILGQYRIVQPFAVGPGTEWLVFRIRHGRLEDHAPAANPFKLAYYIVVHDANDQLRLHYYIVFEDKVAVIHTDACQSSYGAVGGPLPAGIWNIQLIPEVPCQETYRVSWEAGPGALPGDCTLPAEEREYGGALLPSGPGSLAPRLPDPARCLNAAAQWYCGDLHVHTHLSDGKTSPGEMMHAAQACNFDFLMIADHNLVMTSWPCGKPLAVPGTELSTRLGDCNLIGWTGAPPDIRRLLTEDGLWDRQAMLDVFAEARAAGALVSINHPLIKGGFWNFPELPLERIDALEIWNFGSYARQPEGAEAALNVWNVLWNDGYRIPGIGGSDNHGAAPSPRQEDDPPFVPWDVLMYVYAHGLSVDSLVNGIRNRRVYVTRGPHLDAEITVGQRTFGMGDELSAAIARSAAAEYDRVAAGDSVAECDRAAECEIEYALKLNNVKSGEIRWIEDGRIVRIQTIDVPGTYRVTFRWPRGEYHWVRPEIRSADGALQAFANPVFAGSKRPELQTWQDALDRAEVGDAFKVPYAMFRS